MYISRCERIANLGSIFVNLNSVYFYFNDNDNENDNDDNVYANVYYNDNSYYNDNGYANHEKAITMYMVITITIDG